MRHQGTKAWVSLGALALGLTELWGCGHSDLITNCGYDHLLAGTITVTSINASPDEPRSDHGVPCSQYNYTWTTGGPAANPDYDHFYATDACATAGGIQVGAIFEAKRLEGLTTANPKLCGPTQRQYQTEVLVCKSYCN